jgi:hypothetical protein
VENRQQRIVIHLMDATNAGLEPRRHAHRRSKGR